MPLIAAVRASWLAIGLPGYVNTLTLIASWKRCFLPARSLLYSLSSPRCHSLVHHPVIPSRVIREPTCYSISVMRRTWTWNFDLPPDQLWPVLADTNRFNEAMGLPPYVLEETPQPNGTVLRRGSGKAAGFTLAWEEKPYEWIHGRHFRQARVFTKGPFRRFGPVFDLEPDGPAAAR